MVNEEARDRKMHIAFNWPRRPLWVDVDPARMQQVFWNILKNAMKFTQDGGSINIEVSPISATAVSISFVDSGIGMSSQTLKRIFSRSNKERRNWCLLMADSAWVWLFRSH